MKTTKATEVETSDINEMLKAISLNMALCYLKINKTERAIEECNEVLKGDNQNEKALYRRCLAYEKVNDFYKAKADIDRCVEINPNSKEFKQQLQKLRQWEIKEDKKAQNVFRNMFSDKDHEEQEPTTTNPPSQ